MSELLSKGVGNMGERIERGILVGDKVTVLRGKLRGQTYIVWDHWTGADGKKRVELDITSGRKIFCVSSLRLVSQAKPTGSWCEAATPGDVHETCGLSLPCPQHDAPSRIGASFEQVTRQPTIVEPETKHQAWERWLSPGDTFTSWTGIPGLIVVTSPDDCGLFVARHPEEPQLDGQWHQDAVRPGTVRRPVADSCPDMCPRCGTDLAVLGHPQTHGYWGDSNEDDLCSFSWKPASQAPVSDEIKIIAGTLTGKMIMMLRACEQGDNLLGAGYSRQRPQRLQLLRKGLINVSMLSGKTGYQVTERGAAVLAALDSQS